MTKKSNKKSLLVPTIALAIACLGLAIGLTICLISNIKLHEENNKMDAILDVACYYSGDKNTCDRGIKALMGMDLDDIKSFRWGY